MWGQWDLGTEVAGPKDSTHTTAGYVMPMADVTNASQPSLPQKRVPSQAPSQHSQVLQGIKLVQGMKILSSLS